MEIPDVEGKVVHSIHRFPDVALSIGLFVGCFASMELVLWKLYSKILNMEEYATIELLGGMQSFVNKMSAVERVACNANNDANAAIYTKLFDRAREVNTFRNDLMHGLYLERPDGTLWLLGGRTDPTRKTGRTFELKPTLIKSKAVDALKVNREALMLCGVTDGDAAIDIALLQK
jgi:hypothetical protein